MRPTEYRGRKNCLYPLYKSATIDLHELSYKNWMMISEGPVSISLILSHVTPRPPPPPSFLKIVLTIFLPSPAEEMQGMNFSDFIYKSIYD